MIRFDEQNRLAYIGAGDMAYVFHVTDGGGARSLYWGETIAMEDALHLGGPDFHSSFDHDIQSEREEYPLWNGRSFTLPCLKAEGESGRAIFPVYEGYELEEEDGVSRLQIHLCDPAMGLSVRLAYTLYEEEGILARSAVIGAHKQVRLETLMSASVSLPFGQASKARWLTGKWNGEFQISEEAVNPGILTLQSRVGVTGHHFNPAVALAEPSASETTGRVWFAALGYSGNWEIQVEKTTFGNTHIVAGLNAFDFGMSLAPGEHIETPPLYLGVSSAGYGEMSRRMHRFVNRRILPNSGLRPVLYNSWEATGFSVNAAEQMLLAEKAARIGCELFVVDDGWFGGRSSDKAGLGDWRVNAERFPKGLAQLIDHVKSKGMRFGIWVEPESVNPDSDLYRAHPDWIYRRPNAEPLPLRNQYLLNLNLAPVRAYLWDALYALLSEHEISFLKWDMNRPVTDLHGPSALAGELWHGHTKALYEIWADLRQAFPALEMETCAGGGGRIDLGILRVADQAWPSDNTDPYTRLFIQHGFTQFYPPSVMMSWVTEFPKEEIWSKRPLAYRFHCAMCGGLGIGADISKCSEGELEEYARWIARYKQWRHIIQRGELYRLIPPGEDSVSAVQYVTADRREAVVFLFVSHPSTNAEDRCIRLRGLDPARRYATEEGDGWFGSTLMNAGLYCRLNGDFQSRAIYLKGNEHNGADA